MYSTLTCSITRQSGTYQLVQALLFPLDVLERRFHLRRLLRGVPSIPWDLQLPHPLHLCLLCLLFHLFLLQALVHPVGLEFLEIPFPLEVQSCLGHLQSHKLWSDPGSEFPCSLFCVCCYLVFLLPCSPCSPGAPGRPALAFPGGPGGPWKVMLSSAICSATELRF